MATHSITRTYRFTDLAWQAGATDADPVVGGVKLVPVGAAPPVLGVVGVGGSLVAPAALVLGGLTPAEIAAVAPNAEVEVTLTWDDPD